MNTGLQPLNQLVATACASLLQVSQLNAAKQSSKLDNTTKNTALSVNENGVSMNSSLTLETTTSCLFHLCLSNDQELSVVQHICVGDKNDDWLVLSS